jgi:voltage-gated potassium channel Kch
LLWAIFYTIIEILDPGSFAISSLLIDADTVSLGEVFEIALYFSLITLTTVGYGDISPISPVARSLASIEPIIGQLLLAVLVAWLVGMYISDSITKRDQE